MSTLSHSEDAALMSELFGDDDLFGEDVLESNDERAAPPQVHTIGGLHLPPMSAAITGRADVTPPTSSPEKRGEQPSRTGLALPPSPTEPTYNGSVIDRERPQDTTPAPGLEPLLAPAGDDVTPPQAPSKKRKRAAPEGPVYRCRHGCEETLRDKPALRVHHNKVHNCFQEGTAKFWCKHCFKKFATERDHEQHWRSGKICSTSQVPKEWLVWRPETKQERADSWAYKKDGDISKHLVYEVKYDNKGFVLPMEDLPLPMRPPPKAISINGQRKYGAGHLEPLRDEEILFETTPGDNNAANPTNGNRQEPIDLTDDSDNTIIDLTDDIQPQPKRR